MSTRVMLGSPVLAAIIGGLFGCDYLRSEPSRSQIVVVPTPPAPKESTTSRPQPPPPPTAPGRLPDVDSRDRFEITVITCSAPKTHTGIIAVLKGWKFDNIGSRSQAIRTTAERFREASAFAREDSVIYARKQDKDVATRIAWLLNQSQTLRKIAPRDYSVSLGDTPSDEREIYIHTGGGDCPKG